MRLGVENWRLTCFLFSGIFEISVERYRVRKLSLKTFFYNFKMDMNYKNNKKNNEDTEANNEITIFLIKIEVKNHSKSDTIELREYTDLMSNRLSA
jgi:hypothetical protein